MSSKRPIAAQVPMPSLTSTRVNKLHMHAVRYTLKTLMDPAVLSWETQALRSALRTPTQVTSQNTTLRLENPNPMN